MTDVVDTSWNPSGRNLTGNPNWVNRSARHQFENASKTILMSQRQSISDNVAARYGNRAGPTIRAFSWDETDD